MNESYEKRGIPIKYIENFDYLDSSGSMLMRILENHDFHKNQVKRNVRYTLLIYSKLRPGELCEKLGKPSRFFNNIIKIDAIYAYDATIYL